LNRRADYLVARLYPTSFALRMAFGGTEARSCTAIIPTNIVATGLAPIVLTAILKARNAPVNIRPKIAGAADEVIKTAFLVLVFVLSSGPPRVPQGQYETHFSRIQA
jgi:hypothetical protein